MAEVSDDRGKRLEDEYFHKKEKELLAKMKARLHSENVVSTAVKCPKCDGVFNELTYEAIKIDICDQCNGVWLDAGEFAQVVYKDERGWLTRFLG